MNFTENLSALLKERGLTRKKFLEDMHMGKNQFTYWSKSQKLPNPSTLDAIANYFDVPVTYLIGEEACETSATRAMDEVVDWLTDNGYTVEQDENGDYTIGKDGKYCYYSTGDFIADCLAVKTSAANGFELAMREWEKAEFPDTTLTLTDEERLLLEAYRSATAQGRFNIVSVCMSEKEKAATASVG